MSDTALDRVLRNDRTVVLAALATLTLLAWGYVLRLAVQMKMGGMDMTGLRMVPSWLGVMAPASSPWSVVELTLVFLMWGVMMVGMMMPSAAPMILIYARVGRQAAVQRKPFAAAGWFASGYLLMWAAFSAVATLVQWGLERATLLTAAMAVASSKIGALTVIAAGIYQCTALKETCLRHCQAPLAFIQQHGGFRRDPAEALQLGVQHGAYCVGCCWTLMALLFVGGIMNVLWIAGLAALVLVEKIVPPRFRVAPIAGVCLIGAGIWLLYAG